MTKPLKCPFCSCDPYLNKIRRENEDGTWTVGTTLPDSLFKWLYLCECSNCGAHSGNWMKTESGAINKWNRRA